MTAWLMFGVVCLWIGFSAAIVLLTCMLSARFSKEHNIQEEQEPARQAPAGDPGPAIQSRIRVIS